MRPDTKTALLQAAERVARARGFDGFSYADLAQEVGIRKASVHHHFPTKETLSVALLQQYCAHFKKLRNDIDQSHETGAGRLRALVDVYHDALQDGASMCLCVAFSASRDSLSCAALTEICAFRTDLRQWLRDVFQAGQHDNSIAGVSDPRSEAAATLALLEGGQLAARAQRDPSLFTASVEHMLARLKHNQTH